jgi:O-acetyl-ADP-ribose deacetylase (regulator of RNase III)
MQIKVHKGDIFNLDVAGVAYPGTAGGLFHDDFGRRLLQIVGEDLTRELLDRTPIALGATTAMEVNGLRAQWLIYTPLVAEPGDRITVENVRKFTRASVVAAVHHEIPSLALPVIHPNTDTMSLTETTRAMMDELRGYKCDRDLHVFLVDATQGALDSLHRSMDVPR